MDDMLEQLNKLRGVGGSLLLSSDGLTMASRLRNDVDEDALAASVADLISRAYRLSEQSGLGKPRMIHTQTADGGVMLLAAGPSFLAIVVDLNANLALLQLEIRPFLDAIGQRLAM